MNAHSEFSVSDHSLYFGHILSLDWAYIKVLYHHCLCVKKKLLKLSICLVQPKTLSAAAAGDGVQTGS